MTFHASLRRLDPDQRDAVLSSDHATLVHAQVGSGKTTVLVHRAAYLHLEHGVPLDQIAILTFTNRAATEIRERLDALLGRTTTAGERWLVGTFHAVAATLLRRALPVERLGHTRAFAILDDEAEVELVVAVARQHRIRPGRRATLRDRLRAMPVLADAVAAERRARDAMSFDDLIDHATTLLEDSAPAIGHVLVDELQDCEPRELAFVRGLVAATTQFFAVGDPLQSIYGWRGAAPTLFAEVSAQLGCQVRTLPRSYRSTHTLLVGARAILGEQLAIGTLVPVRGPGPKIAILRHHDITAEAAYLAARLAELHREGVAWSELAVLCRLRVQVAELAAALATRGVPCVHDLDDQLEQPTFATAPGVRILTIHAAKGLEFTRVFLSGANVGLLPLLSHEREGDADPAEERRLLFVALTRARDAVEISYQFRPHTHGAFGVPSALLLPLSTDLAIREEPAAPPPVSSDWHVGQRVRHSRYGSGTIVTVAGDTIDCDFGKLGPRAFPRALCPLTAEGMAAR